MQCEQEQKQECSPDYISIPKIYQIHVHFLQCSYAGKILLNPIRTGEGGGIHPPPYGFLPFTQKIFLQPIPKIS